MPPEKTRLALWLVLWAVMVLGIVIPLALGVADVWPWDVAATIPSGLLMVLTVVMALVPQARRGRGHRRGSLRADRDPSSPLERR